MLFRRHSLKSLNKSPQMSPVTKKPNLINTAALLTQQWLTHSWSYVPASADRGGRGANSAAVHRGNVSQNHYTAQRTSYPFPCKLLFWENSALSVLIKLRWKPIRILCIMCWVGFVFVFFVDFCCCCCFHKEILLLIALRFLSSGFSLQLRKAFSSWAGGRHINVGS